MLLSEKISHSQKGLTRYPIASLRELFSLAFPLIITAFSISMLNLTDRILLSFYSQKAWMACCAAMNLLYLPQLGLTIIASISQAFIGYYKGAGQNNQIGPFIWQMIYFSLATIIFSYPFILISKIYLADIEVRKDAAIYFNILAWANFLYPLGATLASFYMGRGKNSMVLLTNLTMQIINIALDFLLIFGVKGWITPLGVQGAAIATALSQGFYCTILFLFFKQKKHQVAFATNKLHLNLFLLWQGLKTGIPRSFGRIFAVGAWTLATYLLIQKGDDYLIVHSFGLTVFMILSFVNEGMGQALLTFNSHILASNSSHYFHKSLRSSFYFLGITMIIFAIPLLVFSNLIIKIYVKDPISMQTFYFLKECCLWVWFAIIGSGINRIGVSMLTASRDTFFYAFCLVFQWITVCVPVFLGIEKFGMSPAKFFLIDGLNSATLGMIFILRFLKKPYGQLKPQSIRIKLNS